MAGSDHTGTSEGSRHHLKIASAYVLAGLLSLLLTQEVYGYYTISTSKESIQTSCYWITDGILHTCEKKEIPLLEVTSIDESHLTEQEYEKSKEGKTKFFKEIDELSIPEAKMLEDFNRLNALMAVVIKKKASKDKTLKPDVRNAYQDINLLDEEIRTMKQKWISLEIPSKDMLVLREIKILELNSIHSVCRDYKEYLDDWSPTIREYAKEHIRQKDLFEASFKRHLEDLKKEKASGEPVL